ncbi:MAG: aldehyde ferredoxin oxidoreductase family protein [Chloroflexota bacterium]|nr:aldehyde ferredoxin oxidoreductase family protein [Chloroflexota bacterium]
MIPGYLGTLLRVDLSDGSVWDEPLNRDYARQFLGGSGLGARYLADSIDKDTDPLGPDNPLIFMTGPLVGTQVPAAGRYSVVARSPATGLTGEANGGGMWGPALRRAGYDGIIITGQAEKPVTLTIVDGVAGLSDASDLWGLNSYDTQDRIKAQFPERPRIHVACIGPAGERLVKYAAVMNDHGRAAARTGMGTVMGSKRLKAIACGGSGRIPLADPIAFKKYLRAAMRFVNEDVMADGLRIAGTMMGADLGFMYGDVPIRYFTDDTDARIEDSISVGPLIDDMLDRAVACYRCPIACGREVHLNDYEVERSVVAGSQVPRIDGPEYETAVGFSALIGSDDLEGAAYAGHLCNLYGLDTISTSHTIGFLYYLFNQGLVNASDVDSLDLSWGEASPAIQLVEKIAHREGIGDLLAEGTDAVAHHFAVPDLAVTVKGLEVPYHDPRAFSGQALVYATASRGADHMAGDYYEVLRGRVVPELGINLLDRHAQDREVAELAVRVMDFRSFTNSAILCHLEDISAENLVGLLQAITGEPVDYAGIMLVGERISTFKRLLNFRLGATRADDRLPKLLRRSLADGGGTEGFAPDVDLLLDLYYQLRQWDPESARPLASKLETLELSDWDMELRAASSQ